MKIIWVRRFSQLFFFLLFLWLGIVSTIGIKWWQIRGWPVELFLHLDPLAAVATILTTHTIYKPLLWALLTIVLTILFGRFFCGWVCPFGSIHHFASYLNNRRKKTRERIALNKYRKIQRIKYYIMIVLLVFTVLPSSASMLQTGLLDPIPLITRTFNLVLLPIADGPFHLTSPDTRFYAGAWLLLSIFLGAILLNLLIPRFYCRVVCPLGAMFGILSRYSLWRIGKGDRICKNDHICERSCEGACEPGDRIRTGECVLCLNCIDTCTNGVIAYQPKPSAEGELVNPDISRRGFLISAASGVFIAPAIRLSGRIDGNWFQGTIRPPGSREEKEFLKRCIKCGQCMRVCPTNVLQPGGLDGGFENLWTPVLNNRIGISGCQFNCVACGQVCPTSAIRPITLEEKHGRGNFAGMGHIKIGTAFVDCNRCLPWAMNRPCIVCQENCPVSPKAIYTDETYETIRNGIRTIKQIGDRNIITEENNDSGNDFATGDYFCTVNNESIRILSYTDHSMVLSSSPQRPLREFKLKIQIRLQRPFVDIEKCNGCGICEHECPVSGKRGIRVSGEGESRSRKRALVL